MNRLLTKSVENNEKIMIYYHSSDKELTQRIVRVLQVNENSILAYCYYRKQVRSFNLENILSASPLNRRVGA